MKLKKIKDILNQKEMFKKVTKKLELVEYNDVIENEYLKYIKEWENTNEIIVPLATRRNSKSFDILLKRWHKDQISGMYINGYVPATLYFLINVKGKVLGSIHFRHKLNDRLLKSGGHIAFGVRPTERKQGYAVVMLKSLLRLIRKMEYKKVLVTCDDENDASRRTIIRCNEVFQDKLVFEGILTRRYWISL